jgi:hypothetical protein
MEREGDNRAQDVEMNRINDTFEACTGMERAGLKTGLYSKRRLFRDTLYG